MDTEIKYDRPNTVAGLIAKHKELTRLREWHKAEIKRLSASLDQIAAVISLFDPSAETDAATTSLNLKLLACVECVGLDRVGRSRTRPRVRLRSTPRSITSTTS